MLIKVFLVTRKWTENEFYDALPNLPSVQFSWGQPGKPTIKGGEGQRFRVEKDWTNAHLSN